MEFTVKVEGLDRIPATNAKLLSAVHRELEKGLLVSAKQVEGEAKQAIAAGGKSGRVYQKYNPRRTHRASAPGEAPATDTGRLINSINGQSVPGKLESEVKAGSGIVKYARMLEYGTIRMAARPFLFPAFERSKGFIVKRLQKAMRDGIASVAKK